GGGGPGGFGRGFRSEAEEGYERRVVTALKGTTSAEVRKWLAGEAWGGAPAPRLEVLAELAGDLKLEEARSHLEKHLDAPEEPVALKCLEALLKIGPGPSHARLAESVKKGKKSLAFRIQVLDALAAAGDAEGVAAVRAAAQDPNPEVRAVALGSLALVKNQPGANQEAFRGIIAGLKDQDSLVRGAALRALQKIRHRDMIPAL